MFRHLILSGLFLIALPLSAQTFSLTAECLDAVRAGESVRNPDIYTTCGFDDRQKAFNEWALWAEEENAAQALYEICARHSDTYQAELYCQKSARLGNGSALLRKANILYKQKRYTEAASLYTQALTSSLLNDAEKGQIAQNMGLLYMNPNSRYYNPQKGMPLIERAIDRRGAEANNLMGVYALFGMQNVPQNAEKSFEYLWRAILLGCPAAEENLGVWHLVKQKKIDNKTAYQEMTERMFSCVAPEYTAPQEIQKSNCNCTEVAERERLASLYPYRLISVSEDGKEIILQDKEGHETVAEKGTTLPDGTTVSEIRTKAAFLTSVQKRMVLNLAPVDNCPQLCQKQTDSAQIKRKKIKPYHLTFTSGECADILYYAERLVDTNLPFTGKKECHFSADMDKTADLLMSL